MFSPAAAVFALVFVPVVVAAEVVAAAVAGPADHMIATVAADHHRMAAMMSQTLVQTPPHSRSTDPVWVFLQNDKRETLNTGIEWVTS